MLSFSWDYLKQMREEGMEREEAILETGGVRLRPILMTALATILAMLPIALGLGEGGRSHSTPGHSGNWRTAGFHPGDPGFGAGGLYHTG